MHQRTPLIVGNWKMHLGPDDATRHATAVAEAVANLDPRIELGVCPPFISIPAVRQALRDSRVTVGAQDGFPKASGAFTGEVSMAMLEGLVSWVIVGHSERRQYFGESDEVVCRKVAAAVNYGIAPILCVGETAERRAAGVTKDVLVSQTWNALVGLQDPSTLVVAYEPVWAIGTGNNAEVSDVENAAAIIRDVVTELFDAGVAEQLRVLYGGSVTAANASGFLMSPHIDGALVGAASLKVDAFKAIAEAAS
jgi:triosephosphate isomerase